jgi:hypothetical protein
VKVARFRPGRKLRDDVELAEQLPDHFTRVVALTELFDFPEDAERAFSAGDGNSE